MVLRTAGRAQYIGHQFWGCSTFPQCRARVDLADAGAAPNTGGRVEWATSPAGASAQAEFERRRDRNRARMRRQWPYALVFGLIVCAIVFAIVEAVTDQAGPAVLVAAALALAQAAGFFQASTVRAWRVGAEGERRTAAHLEPLLGEGFVILHDRMVTGWGGNLDHVAIGPTGMAG